MSIPMQRYPIFDVASPLRDLVFYEVVDYNIKSNRDMEYGTPHHNTQSYPNHQLVYITPNDKEGKTYRFYYAANRENQDDYNWQISSGEQLIRTYLIERELYYERSEAEAASSFLVNDEFTYPVVGTPDTRFAKYGFADDTVNDAPQELASRYILIQRRFLEPVTNTISWNEDFKKNINVKKELIPALLSHTPPTQVAGKTIEIQKGNRFHDVRITSELLPITTPFVAYQKTSIPGYQAYDFPDKLSSIKLVYVWAWAASTSAVESYSEDSYFDYKIVKPRPGPYSATILRWITDNPNAIKDQYPLSLVPSPVRESIAVVYAWFKASLEGNTTDAVANEQVLPASIHGAITVEQDGQGVGTQPSRTRRYTSSFAETPGYGDFILLNTMTIGYEVRELPLNLYEVKVIQIDKSNLYGG
jgi:hypothetical protein